MKYTKGEWKAQAPEHGGLWVRLTGAYAIAEVLTTNEGDCHLIAAAPDMYEALRLIILSHPLPGEIGEQAAHALNKAEGKAKI